VLFQTQLRCLTSLWLHFLQIIKPPNHPGFVTTADELSIEEFANSRYMRDGWVYVDGNDAEGRSIVVSGSCETNCRTCGAQPNAVLALTCLGGAPRVAVPDLSISKQLSHDMLHDILQLGNTICFSATAPAAPLRQANTCMIASMALGFWSCCAGEQHT
jgi:hypothetical protein